MPTVMNSCRDRFHRHILSLALMLTVWRPAWGQEATEVVPCPYAQAAARAAEEERAAREAQLAAVVPDQAVVPAILSPSVANNASESTVTAEPASAESAPIFTLSQCPVAMAQRLRELEEQEAAGEILQAQNSTPSGTPLALPPPAPGLTPGPATAPSLGQNMRDRLTFADRLAGRQPPPSADQPYFRPMLSTPSIFGDSTAGGCGQANFFAGAQSATLEHPTFNCIRANLAENNSPLPRDRFYFRYNHFHNITNVAIFPSTLPDGSTSLHVDRFTFGSEFTFLDGRVSLETRVPFARQLASDLTIYDIQGNYNLPLQDYKTELLNIQFILKTLLYADDKFAMSGGAGLNLPTGEDFRLRLFIDDDNFQLVDPVLGQVGTIPVNLDISGAVNNSIYNLSPFFAMIWTPHPRWFFQSFNQLDVPLNTTSAHVVGQGDVLGIPFRLPLSVGHLRQQTLMRLSANGGYWFVQRPEAKWLKGWAGVLELHYTTTLQTARTESFQVPLLQPFTANVTVGNLANRVDILNLTVGSQFRLGERSTLGVGLIAPISQGTNKPFDAEVNVIYNLQL